MNHKKRLFKERMKRVDLAIQEKVRGKKARMIMWAVKRMQESAELALMQAIDPHNERHVFGGSFSEKDMEKAINLIA